MVIYKYQLSFHALLTISISPFELSTVSSQLVVQNQHLLITVIDTIMLARLRNAIAPPSAPSTLLVIGNFGAMINILHLLPEDGAIERFGLGSAATTFHRYGATEQARQQIGTVTLYAGDGETPCGFLDDVETRVRKLWNESQSSGPASMETGNVNPIQLVHDILRQAGHDAIRQREGRQRSMNATQTYPVYVVSIRRSRLGRIVPTDHLTSFG